MPLAWEDDHEMPEPLEDATDSDHGAPEDGHDSDGEQSNGHEVIDDEELFFGYGDESDVEDSQDAWKDVFEKLGPDVPPEDMAHLMFYDELCGVAGGEGAPATPLAAAISPRPEDPTLREEPLALAGESASPEAPPQEPSMAMEEPQPGPPPPDAPPPPAAPDEAPPSGARRGRRGATHFRTIPRWGSFTIIYRPVSREYPCGAWQACCRYHKKNEKTMCTKTINIPNAHDDSVEETLQLAKIWCIHAPMFTKKKDHSKFPFRDADRIPQELLDVQVLELPAVPEVVIPDDQMPSDPEDAQDEEGEAGTTSSTTSNNSSSSGGQAGGRGRARGRGRGKGQARGRGKPKAKAKAKGGGVDSDSSLPSDMSSLGTSLSA